MKTLLSVVLFCLSLCAMAQTDNEILIQVQVVDPNGTPIPDVYIVNLRTQEKDVSLHNGVFTVWVTPDDSFAVSHISYERKIVSANSVLINPKIVLESENVSIKQVNVSANQKSDMERAMENIEQMKLDMRTQPDDNLTESERVQQTVTANNRLERTSAGMLSLLKFSPSTGIKKVANKIKKDENGSYYSTKKTQEEVEAKEKARAINSIRAATSHDTISANEAEEINKSLIEPQDTLKNKE